MSKKKSPGQPHKYKPEYCQMLEDHMAEGFTYESFAGRIRVDYSTLFNWEKQFPEFFQSKKAAAPRQRFANEERMHKIAQGKIRNANVTAQIFIMKNCHGWKDRTEVTEVSPDKMNRDEVLAEAKKLLAEVEE
jgi:hypothetical protein